jgi:hypothetical protein
LSIDHAQKLAQGRWHGSHHGDRKPPTKSKMNYTNPYTNKPETKEERIARYVNDEKTYRARAKNLPGGFKGKMTRTANEIAARIIELKAA